jgi:hypothetical protein
VLISKGLLPWLSLASGDQIPGGIESTPFKNYGPL